MKARILGVSSSALERNEATTMLDPRLGPSARFQHGISMDGELEISLFYSLWRLFPVQSSC